MEHAEETKLLQQIQRNEPGAFDRFVSLFEDRIYRFGMRMCGEREDARDVLQDTLIQAYISLKNLRHPEALRSWVYRVAANACLMMRRKGKFEPKREVSLESLMPVGSQGPRAEIPDPAALPDEELVSSELRQAVRAAVEDLPPHYRIVLVLRDMEHLPTTEVASALDLPESTIKMRLHRARLMVRQSLETTLSGGRAARGSQG
jgi:RNA polymerase sigma-70 factor, ECF subfamily